MPEEDNAALVATFLDELWNKQNLVVIDQLTVEDYVMHIPQGDLVGREDLKLVATDYFDSFSHIKLSIRDQTCQDSQVVTFLEWETALILRDRPSDEERHQPSDEEIEREIPARGISIDRIANGQLAESWFMLDTLYWLFNIRELNRDPSFIQTFPAIARCNPSCPRNCKCIGGHPPHCVCPHHS